MRAPLAIPELTAEELAALDTLYRTTREVRLRTRAQMVLLAGETKTPPAYRAQLLAAVRQRPRSLGQPYSLWTLQRLADYLAELTGIRVSYETVRALLKAGGGGLSRPPHTVTSPDPEYRVKKRRSSRLATASRRATPSPMPTSST